MNELELARFTLPAAQLRTAVTRILETSEALLAAMENAEGRHHS